MIDDTQGNITRSSQERMSSFTTGSAILALAAMAEVAQAFTTAPTMPLRQSRTTSPAALSSLLMVRVTVDQKGEDKSFDMDKDDILRTGMQKAGVEVYYTMKGKAALDIPLRRPMLDHMPFQILDQTDPRSPAPTAY